jgi:hypothetical protein
VKPVVSLSVVAVLAISPAVLSFGANGPARHTPGASATAAVPVAAPTPPMWRDEVSQVVAGELAELNQLIRLQHRHALRVQPDPPSYSR